MVEAPPFLAVFLTMLSLPDLLALYWSSAHSIVVAVKCACSTHFIHYPQALSAIAPVAGQHAKDPETPDIQQI